MTSRYSTWFVIVLFVGLMLVTAWFYPSRSSIALGELHQAAANLDDQTRLAALIRGETDRHAQRETAISAMPCFWSGEGFYGSIHGVYKTTPGMIGADEVVEVEFDPSIITYQSLMSQAHHAGKATKIYCRSDQQLAIAKSIVGEAAIRSDEPIKLDEYPKWYILQTPLKSVPLSPVQACRINSALHARQEIDSLLSPTQKILYENAKREAASR